VPFGTSPLRGLKSRRVQCDEIWSFVDAKERTSATEKKAQDWGDCWTWGLQRIIDAKITVQEVIAQEPAASPKVVNLMEALKQSLNAVSERKKRPAKSQPRWRPNGSGHRGGTDVVSVYRC